MDKEEKKIRYLEFIENVISRMADCSFRCKEFCILIISALLAVYASVESHPVLIIFACAVTTFIFWCLDSFYLFKERQYTHLYKENNDVAKEITVFELKVEGTFKKYLSAMFKSISTLPMYLFLICGMIFLGLAFSKGWFC